MTCIIAIETATEACSAALLVRNKNKIIQYTRFQIAPREHTKLILPMLDDVLDDAKLKITDIDAIAFGRGPGAFTGLRIATGIAQGLALSIDKPTIPVSSLSAMALMAKDERPSGAASSNYSILVAIDARMGEVYWAEYSGIQDKLEIIGEEQLSAPQLIFDKAQLLAKTNLTILIGSGWDVYLGEFRDAHPSLDNIQHIFGKFPDAQQIALLALSDFDKGQFQDIADAQPVYLRNNVAEKSKKQI